MAYTQDARICSLTTELGADVLLVRRLEGEERLSHPFHFRLELLAENAALDCGSLIGRPATLRFQLGESESRPVQGIVIRFSQAGADRRFTVYRADLVPWFWLTRLRADCRIFQNKTVPDIVKDVFDRLKFTDYEFRLSESYEPWVNCVQYRESDFDFVSRLLETEGIFYFFEHDEQAHKLIMADSPSHHPVVPGPAPVPYDPEGALRGEAVIDGWETDYAMRPGKYALCDFNFGDPATELLVESPSTLTFGQNPQLEIYDYPGGYVKLGTEEEGKFSKGEARIKIRRQEGDAQALVVRGSGGCSGFQAGHRFDLDRHYRDDANAAWLLTGVRHHLDQSGSFETGAGGPSRYENEFTCMPHGTPFRPPRLTPKPRVDGPQTALVVGAKDEEIFTDKHGRVKVQFHWDRESQADETSSCWVRVAQPWAGKQWGGVFLPRVGHEVVVTFLEGDPDRPLITGSVYNAAAPPPYELPANATRSGIKSLSSKGGGGFNEIRFEDLAGKEEIFIHAQHNQDIRVEADCRETVGNDRHLKVERDLYEHVENNRHAKIDADHYEEIGKDRHLKVAGKEAKEIGASLSLKVGGDAGYFCQGSHAEEVSNTLSVKANEVVLEGLSKLTLKVGGSHIVLDPSGISLESGAIININGSLTKLNSGSGSGAGSSASPSLVEPAAPDKAAAAGTAEAGDLLTVKPHKPPQDGDEQETKTSWLEIELVDEEDEPVPGERYRIELPDGTTASGTLDEKGFARIEGIEPGSCKVSFPELDQDAWEKA